MKLDRVRELVQGVPFIHPDNARYIHDLILRERPARILELGIAHGTGTCYLAAALDELNAGRITSVDLIGSEEWFKPTPEEQLAKTGLARFVEIVRMQTGYTWFLHDAIRRQTVDGVCTPVYDLCIIDGCKNWTIDGCAFFLVDKLLKPGGRIIFDDYGWTYAAADQRRDSTDGIMHRELSAAEREVSHIREIFDLLVRPHPNYGEFEVFPETDWAIARKQPGVRQKKYTTHYLEARPSALVQALSRNKQQLLRLLKSS